MKLSALIEELKLDVKVPVQASDPEVRQGYASDLLSDVLGNAREDDLWVTLQVHPNTVAVASIKGLAGIVLVNSREPEEETVARAREEGMPLLVSDLPAFELIGRLHALGLTGKRDDAEGV